MARVYIAYTGGTIGMAPTQDGYAPRAGYLAELMHQMPELRAPQMPEYTVHEYGTLLDSANMTPQHWLEIARDIEAHYDDYDGFIVLHGTDTMAYTASALPFMLEGLAKPVILTGSQIPLCEVRSDARANLINALLIAGAGDIPEVCLCFGDRLLRGCRAQKLAADGLNAFDSPNFAPLGRLGITIDIERGLVRPPMPDPDGLPFHVQALVNPPVAVLRLFPGVTGDLVRLMTQPPLRGLVLETYGVGNGPDRDPDFLAALSEATERGVVIVACTQCVRGAVDLGAYRAGSALARAGVLGGADMTAEAALAKMFYLFSRGLPVEAIRELIGQDLRGELTA
ncbi:MAG: asparaginase [Anaerolineae bacterium]|jgi:L-asparaginase|nr:asparaginase [Anaerolineae bacterium]